MITFRNKGLVDLRAITTFGVNSKETDNPIGQFGTGFKYAVAVTLRLGGTITVMRGLERYVFTARQEKIRNDEFGLVYMNDTPLGFTTHLGHHWEPWQAFRELYCNMLDEKGEAVDTELPAQEDTTSVYLDGAMFTQVWADRHTLVLPPKMKPIHADDRLQIYNGPSQYLYYRGVRVATLEKPAKHIFNVLQKLELTEDRTIASLWSAKAAIANRITRIENKSVLRGLLFAGIGTFENELEYGSWMDSNSAFTDVIHKGRANADLNAQALAYYRIKNPAVILPKRVTNVQRQEKRDLVTAVQLCAVLGYDVKDYPVVISDELPEGVLGCVFPTHSDKIFLSRRVFTQGAVMVAGTLLEEYLHLKYALPDTSRQLQNHLLDALVRAAQRLMLTPGGGQ